MKTRTSKTYRIFAHGTQGLRAIHSMEYYTRSMAINAAMRISKQYHVVEVTNTTEDENENEWKTIIEVRTLSSVHHDAIFDHFMIEAYDATGERRAIENSVNGITLSFRTKDAAVRAAMNMNDDVDKMWIVQCGPINTTVAFVQRYEPRS